MIFKYLLQTRYSETAQDGIIHHSSYIPYLEEARIAYFKSLGYAINHLEKEKKFCIVVDLSVKYIKPLYSGEEVEVHVRIESSSKVRFRLNYKIYRGKECVTTASTSHCFLNDRFKPIPLQQCIKLS